jgi:hypothetical protein
VNTTSSLQAGEVVVRKFGVTLDWSDPSHWDDDELADCRLCHTPTHYRDGQDRPFHKSCAEQLLAEQTGGQPIVDERFPTPAQQARQGQTEVTR